MDNEYTFTLEAADSLKQKAEAGNRFAMNELADRYYMGRDGFEEDLEQARLWYGRAADLGVQKAQYRYASMLSDGEGGDYDEYQARDYYMLAANNGCIGAASTLENGYKYGYYRFEIDPTLCQYWAEIHASLDGTQTDDLLGSMYSILDGERFHGTWLTRPYAGLIAKECFENDRAIILMEVYEVNEDGEKPDVAHAADFTCDKKKNWEEFQAYSQQASWAFLESLNDRPELRFRLIAIRDDEYEYGDWRD